MNAVTRFKRYRAIVSDNPSQQNREGHLDGHAVAESSAFEVVGDMQQRRQRWERCRNEGVTYPVHVLICVF